MIRIKINGVAVQPIPENFNEFTPEQLFDYFKILQVDSSNIAANWLKYFLNDEQIQKIPSGKLADTALEVQRILKLTSKPLTFNKFQSIELSKKLIGAKDYLRDVSFGRFVEADEQFWLYTKTKNSKHLHRLIAVLYLYATERSYNNITVTERAELIATEMDLAHQAIIFEFYNGCRDFLSKRFDLVFPKSSDSSAKGELTLKAIKKMKEAFNTVMIDFAKTPDRKPDIYNTNLFTVLEFVQRNIQKNNELKELYAQKK